MDSRNNLGAPVDSAQPQNFSAAANQAWDLWVRTVTVLTLAYPDAKLTDEEVTARTAMYCESLAPNWRDEGLIQRALAKGRTVWKFFPTIAEIHAACERQSERDWRDRTPGPRVSMVQILASDEAKAKARWAERHQPLTLSQLAEIERVKQHLANRAKASRTLPPVPPAMVAVRQHDRSRLTAGASPDWRVLMDQPIP